MVMLTRGVCLAAAFTGPRRLPGDPGFLAIASAEVTMAHAMRPDPAMFSLEKTKIVSPLAICLPPFIVF